MHPSSDSLSHPSASAAPGEHKGAARVLAWTLFLVPALGVPSELMLQDTLKSAVAAFGILIAALVFFWQQRNRTQPLLWHGLVWLPLALMAYALGSMVWSHTYLAGVEAIRWFLLSLLLWLGLNTLSRENLPTVIWGMHAGAVVASLWVALQFWFDWRFFPQGAPPASTFINRNFFAEYAVCVLPFSVWLLTNMRVSRWLVWMALSIALQVVSIMMTGTRSALAALLGLGVVFSVILIKYHRQCSFGHLARIYKATAAIILVAFIGIMGSIPSGNPQVIGEKTGTTALQRSFLRTASMAKPSEYTEGSFSIRAQMWMATARMVLANPLTGVGAGAWEVQIPLYQRTYTVLETDYYAHNEFLQLLSEYGVVVGGMVLAFLLAYLLHAAGSTWHLRGAYAAHAPLRAFTLASVLALLIVSNAGFPWHLAGCGAVLALGLAILARSDARLGQQERFFASSLRWRPLYSHVALAATVSSTGLAAYVTQQAVLAEYQLLHAILLANSLKMSQRTDTPTLPDRRAEMLQSARNGIAINPHYRKLTAELAEPFAAAGEWKDAIWILESVAASRPHVAAIWTGLAMGYSQLNQQDRAQAALQQVQRVKPNAISTQTLEVILLNQSGEQAQAASRLQSAFDQGEFNFDMVQAGYAIGYKTRNWALAIRSLELRIVTWPEHSADGYFRLGKLYAEPDMQDETKALAAFKAGLDAVPEGQKADYIQQVPQPYRAIMQ
jgi:O-antigen ligase